MITAKELRDLLIYNQKTGIFRWRDPGTGRRNDLLAGSANGDGYWHIEIHGRSYKLHRLAWLYIHGRWPKGRTDHVDGDPSNNAIANLRECTASQNGGNSRKPRRNTSGFKGVALSRGRYVARIMVQRKMMYLGSALKAEDAHAFYVTASRKYFGEYARIE